MIQSIRTRSQILLILFVLLLIGTAKVSTKVSAAEVEEIFKQAMAIPNAIQSYEFLDIETCVGINGSDVPIARQCTFYQSGGMFRTELRWQSKNEMGDLLNAYNGTRYQQFWDKTGTLTFSNKNRHSANSYFATNPLIVPYMWILDPGNSWSDLKSPDLWSKKASQAKFQGRETVNSHECAVITLPYGLAEGVSLKVYLASRLGYYPIRFTGAGADTGISFEMDVLEFTTIKQDGLNVIVPLTLKLNDTAPRVQTIDLKVSKDSVKINQKLPESLFTLSPSMAKVIDDYDRNTKILETKMQAKPPAPASGTSLSYWLLLINVALVVALSLAFAASRFRRSRQS